MQEVVEYIGNGKSPQDIIDRFNYTNIEFAKVLSSLMESGLVDRRITYPGMLGEWKSVMDMPDDLLLCRRVVEYYATRCNV